VPAARLPDGDHLEQDPAAEQERAERREREEGAELRDRDRPIDQPPAASRQPTNTTNSASTPVPTASIDECRTGAPYDPVRRCGQSLSPI